LYEVSVRVDHVMESRGVMNIHVVEHSILYGIEYCTFWFRSVVEMTRPQLLLQCHGSKAVQQFSVLGRIVLPGLPLGQQAKR
jgi:hypothetical protein